MIFCFNFSKLLRKAVAYLRQTAQISQLEKENKNLVKQIANASVDDAAKYIPMMIPSSGLAVL